MRLSQLLAGLAVSAFVVSHFLPAYARFPGFGCEQAVWSALIREPFSKPYFAAFALTNAGFVFLTIASFTSLGHRAILRLISIVLLAHVLSWLALVGFWYVSGTETEFRIRAGYYLWATAYGFLVWVYHEKKEEAAPTPSPLTAAEGGAPSHGSAPRGPGRE
jgi:hypothetical protein